MGRRAVLFQWDPAYAGAFWLARDYLPSFRHAAQLPFAAVRAALGATREQVVPILHDCRDGFLMAYRRRPGTYLDPTVRANISVCSLLPAAEVAAMVAALRADLRSGRWDRRNADLLARDEHDFGDRLLVAE